MTQAITNISEKSLNTGNDWFHQYANQRWETLPEAQEH